MNHLVDALASTLFAVRLSANVPVDRHAMYRTQPESMRRVFRDEAEAILSDPVFRRELTEELAKALNESLWIGWLRCEPPDPVAEWRMNASVIVSNLLSEVGG